MPLPFDGVALDDTGVRAAVGRGPRGKNRTRIRALTSPVLIVYRITINLPNSCSRSSCWPVAGGWFRCSSLLRSPQVSRIDCATAGAPRQDVILAIRSPVEERGGWYGRGQSILPSELRIEVAGAAATARRVLSPGRIHRASVHLEDRTTLVPKNLYGRTTFAI